MTPLERTINFIEGRKVDRVPFQPLLMQFAAKYAGVNYRDYCLDYKKKCDAHLKVAEDFSMDWMHVGGHPYTEAIDYGLDVEIPVNSLPFERGHLINGESDLSKIRPLNIENSATMMGRVEGIAHAVERCGDYMAICGWAEGPMAEYADLRGLSGACMDLIDFEDEMEEVFEILTENTKKWITLQIQAGAQLIGIGDAACSQIGPVFYEDFIYDHHKEIIAHIHSLGAYSNMHICGNTAPILDMVLSTGVNIIDIDYLVKDLVPFVDKLGPKQVIRGNADPVSQIQNSTPDAIKKTLLEIATLTKGRGMVSAGCEIPVDTPIENLKAMSEVSQLIPLN